MTDNKGRGRGRAVYEAEYETEQNNLTFSYFNPAWVPYLNANTVLDYFTDKFNPFYDHTCNNEIIKMRGMVFKNQEEVYEQLRKMQGIEYIHVHTFGSILHIVRKQRRSTPTSEVPLANYYIIAGVIYQAPDLMSIIQTRLTTSIHYLQAAFEEVFNYARFHPSTDYFWDFPKDSSQDRAHQSKEGDNKDDNRSKAKNEKEISNSESHDIAQQMYRVDVLIRELVKKFPPPTVKVPEAPSAADSNGGEQASKQQNTTDSNNKEVATNANATIKTEIEDDGGKVMPPPNKRTKLA